VIHYVTYIIKISILCSAKIYRSQYKISVKYKVGRARYFHKYEMGVLVDNQYVACLSLFIRVARCHVKNDKLKAMELIRRPTRIMTRD